MFSSLLRKSLVNFITIVINENLICFVLGLALPARSGVVVFFGNADGWAASRGKAPLHHPPTAPNQLTAPPQREKKHHGRQRCSPPSPLVSFNLGRPPQNCFLIVSDFSLLAFHRRPSVVLSLSVCIHPPLAVKKSSRIRQNHSSDLQSYSLCPSASIPPWLSRRVVGLDKIIVAV